MLWDNEDFLTVVLSVLDGIRNLGQQALDYANAASPQVLTVVDTISNYAVKPLASTLFAMFAVMQIYKVMDYLNDIGAPPGGTARFEKLGFSLLKIGFIFFVITGMSNFMWGLVSAGNWLIGKIQFHGSYSGAQDFTVLEERIAEMLSNETAFQKFSETLGIGMNLLIVDLLIWVCGAIVFILFYARMLQILIMVAFSPIPIVTLIHDEHKQIGISFIKSFSAVVLQGAVMVALIYIYSHVVTYSMTNATSLTGMVWHAAGYAVLLVVALATSGSLSKKIVNAI